MFRNFVIVLFFCGIVLNAQEIREIENLKKWNFHKGDVPENGGDFKYKDLSYITIPHSWGWAEAQKGNKKYYRGVGWYFKNINTKPKQGKRYFLKFEAASLVADVYVNDEHVGQHRGGFSAFCFEITKQLKYGRTNRVAVKVNNKRFEDVAPLGGDFNIYGGIYRPVSLIETNAVCINPTDHGAPGVKWLMPKVSKKKAEIELTTWISNGTKKGLPFNHYPKKLGETLQDGLITVKAKILDAQGGIAASNSIEANLTPNMTIPVYQNFQVKNPHLWNGVKDPYLYTGVVEIYKEGVLVDKVSQQIGFRSVKIDPQKGFFLNGKKYPINGVSKHQDWKDKGWSVDHKEMETDIQLIREMGANAIRLAHYQHNDYTLSLCDKEGILVWSEIPQVGSTRNTKEFIYTSQEHLKDMIRQGVNHPSIFAWGMFNEVHVKVFDPHRQFVDLQNISKSEDPTRFTVAATSHYMSPEMNKIFDILGWNRYPGWYDPISHTEDHEMWKKYQPTSKSGGICFSEYGAGANIEHHEQNPAQPVPRSFWHPEEWQSLAHEKAWSQFKSHDFIWGTFIWNMFDFGSSKRREGGQKGINDKGLVTFDRKIKKDAFYFYKANWSKEPVLLITSKRHKTRNKKTTPIKVYSNLKKVTLKINGKVISTQKPNDKKIVIWKNIELVKGRNSIIVISKENGEHYKDEVFWIYDPNVNSSKPVINKKKKRIHGDGGFGRN